jgi:hypothetical protein
MSQALSGSRAPSSRLHYVDELSEIDQHRLFHELQDHASSRVKPKMARRSGTSEGVNDRTDVDHPDDGLGLGYVERVAVNLKEGTRVYVPWKCAPSIPYGFQFMVEEVNEEAVVVEYSDWIAESYYRPQRVRVPPATRN